MANIYQSADCNSPCCLVNIINVHVIVYEFELGNDNITSETNRLCIAFICCMYINTLDTNI